jgi:hypothetical protein
LQLGPFEEQFVSVNRVESMNAFDFLGAKCSKFFATILFPRSTRLLEEKIEKQPG